MIKKFRFYNTEEKLMISGEYWLLIDGNGQVYEYNMGKHLAQEKDKYKVMQFTGLHDKNGVEIYEGDLLKNTLIKPQIIECFCEDKIIGSAGFAFKFRKMPSDENMMLRWETTDIEVIGNIYENPEIFLTLK